MSKLLSKVLLHYCGGHAIWCSGCETLHRFSIDKPQSNGAQWSWDGNVDAPTFSPSMLVNASYPTSRCHSFVKAGKIQYLNDCHHALAGQTIDLPPIPESMLD